MHTIKEQHRCQPKPDFKFLFLYLHFCHYLILITLMPYCGIKDVNIAHPFDQTKSELTVSFKGLIVMLVREPEKA